LRGRVDGLLQTSSREPNGRPRMELTAIRSGEIFLISQNLGGDSKACCVDVAGIARASAYLRRALADPPDLLIINKFSGLEAKGGGLRAEMLDALAMGIPVLCGLSARHQDAFDAMTQGAGTYLPADLSALQGWWAKACAPPEPVHPGC
jgi:hypothetical protein